MIDKILNNSIVICNNNIKNKLLLKLSNNKEIKNIKFMSLKEFTNNYVGSYDNNAIYYLMKKYHYSYDVSKLYLDNIFYNYDVLKDLYFDLEDNKYLLFNKHFKNYIKGFNIYLIGYYDIDKYLLNILQDLNYKVLDYDDNKINDVYEFNSISEEISFVIEDIILKHKDELNKVYIVNVDNTYLSELKRVSKLCNLKININDKNSIYSTKIVQDFLYDLINTKDILVSVNKLKKSDISNKIIDILNKYDNEEVDEYFIELLKGEFKSTYISDDLLIDAVNVIDIDDIFENDKYYYILNFNQGVIPKIFHDDDLIPDIVKKKLNLNTSYDKLINFKKYFIKIINSFNVTLTYKLKDNYNEFIKSPLIDELNLNIIRDYNKKYNYSNAYNKLSLSIMLDNYNKFNILDDNLSNLYTTYKDIKYNKFDNKYKPVNFDSVNKIIKNELKLSYTSMNSYFNCSFKYYLDNILRINKYEEKFANLIGNLYHFVLSKMYDEEFDLKRTYGEFLINKELTNKEKYFINKLYYELESIIHVIKYQDTKSKFNKVLTEKYIEINKKDFLNVKIVGYIDKIKLFEDNGLLYMAIIDYKTGENDASLDNINNGLNMQLPIYIYLAKNSFDDVRIIGFYIQKILNNKAIDSESVKLDRINSLKLLGYTIDDENIIKLFDNSYENSDVIKSMKKTKTGFYSYTKLVNDDDVNMIYNIVDKNINKIVKAIRDCDFSINPKRINNEIISCKYCSYKDICYKKEEDIVDITYSKIDDILGGDNNGMD